MIIALHIHDMTAEVVSIFNHPHGKLVEGRGSLQFLENSNVFLGWWMYSLISEHAPDGTLLCEASWRLDLNSYRSYKFEWIGRPTLPPDVYAEAVGVGRNIRTDVYVSWNGATEVHKWILYKTDLDGSGKEQVNTTLRRGFETLLSYDSFAGYVVVEGIDHEGRTLRQSTVTKTIELDDLLPLDQAESAVEPVESWVRIRYSSFAPRRVDPTLAGFGLTFCIVIVLTLKSFRGSRRWIARARWHNMWGSSH
jgi:hypothetical protein